MTEKQEKLLWVKIVKELLPQINQNYNKKNGLQYYYTRFVREYIDDNSEYPYVTWDLNQDQFSKILYFINCGEIVQRYNLQKQLQN